MEVGQRYRHLRRGTSYTVVALGSLQVATEAPAEGERMVAYRGADGDVWFRTEAEFLDGRFELVDVETGARADPPIDTSAIFRMQLEYQWWFAASEDAEHFDGKAGTREQAIELAKAFYLSDAEQNHETGRFDIKFALIEGAKEPLRLSELVAVDDLVERADEAVLETEFVTEDDEAPFFAETVSPIAADLERRIKTACDEWQIANDIYPKTLCVSAVRSAETITMDVTEEREAALSGSATEAPK